MDRIPDEVLEKVASGHYRGLPPDWLLAMAVELRDLRHAINVMRKKKRPTYQIQRGWREEYFD